MARYAELRFDLILSAELSRHYKPDPETYLMAYEFLALEPHQFMMAAAHNDDLLAAGQEGLRTDFSPGRASTALTNTKTSTLSTTSTSLPIISAISMISF